MIQKSARAGSSSSGEIFRQETVLFESISNQSKLFIDFQLDSENLKNFYPKKNASLVKFAEQVFSKYEIDRRALCDALLEANAALGAGEKTFANIELLRQTDCAAIVTGQQAGLFSGALYTIYKALSAVRLAEELKRKDLKTVPVFWIAEEDHDFDEVKKTFNLNKEGKLTKSENTPENLSENRPVGIIKFDETINKTVENLLKNLPHTEFTDEVKNLVSETYQSGETYSRAFGKLIAKLFTDYGLIILTPLDEKLKKLCAPIFEAAIEKSDRIVSALLERNRELETENYQPQVLVADDFFPFFYQNETGERQSLRKNKNDANVAIRHSKIEYKKFDLLEIARRSPQNLSPNALMRPVVQDYLLPTVCYIGGAAEIAYFAQNSVIYEILKRPVTPIRHRASLTVVERKHARTLEKYQLKIQDLFDGAEPISARIVEKFLNRGAAELFAEVEKNVNHELDRLDAELKNVEPTLAANLTTRRRKILWHLDALRKRYHRAEITKNETAQRRIESLFTALLPHKALQERTVNVITFLNLYGENFVDWIYEAIETEEKNHQILYL